jgi:hypothetical protein
MSKVFERIMADQLMAFFCSKMSDKLSAYRKGYNCQHVILQLTEFWRRTLDNDSTAGTIAMDLSKAFDCMPHALLIAKLSAYGLSNSACRFIISYLKNRKQCVKVMGSTSPCATINRGVPQGSVLGPLLFNIFINDLFLLDLNGSLANYADDNHLYNENKSILMLKDSLECDIERTTAWFHDNYMHANTDKFQSIILNRGTKSGNISVSIQGNATVSNTSIKVLGVTLDDNLKFDEHVSKICKSASGQINALKRVSKFLNVDSRILIYQSFISSNFSYCPVTWLFCGKKNATKLEKLQERALRFVYRDFKSSYFELLQRGNFLSLSTLRLRYLAIEMYKCVHGINPPYLNELFQLRTSSYSLRDSSRLLQPKYSTVKYGFRSFRYYGSKLWNALPSQVKNSESLHVFKRKITAWCYTKSCNDLLIF